MAVSRSQLSKIAWITLAFTIVSLFQYFIAYAVLVDYGFADQLDLAIPFKASLITGLSAGLMGGTASVILWEKWLITKPYGWTLRNALISYSIIFILVNFITTFYFERQLSSSAPLNSAFFNALFQRMVSPITLVPFFTWLAVSGLTVIALLVNDKYGPGVFKKFLLGHYSNPKREERIFMFLDLRSSTSIAEQLGEEKYFSFLKEVFKFSTPAILRNKGEIYQYVGDEIVISWELEKGKKDAHCIHCFFEIQKALNKRKGHFEKVYGHHPEFKAGIHCGPVMAGEIGIVKREIAFSGDVLNTTARIQSKCNEMGVNILTSKVLIDLLAPLDGLNPERIGSIELRGKKEAVTLYTLEYFSITP